MKSKLFLSLSLLTAVFSMNANLPTTYVNYVDPIFGQSVSQSSVIGHMPTQAHRTFAAYKLRATSPFVKGAAIAILPSAALIGGGLLAQSYMQPKVEVKPNYLQRAKAQVQAGFSSVKANVTKGYTLAMNNKGKTAGAVAVVAALGYAAYKSDIFGNSKAVVTTPEVKATPVARLHTIRKHLRD